MREIVDLHSHTNRSDGFFTPVELVEQAATVGLRALAITDHDTLGAHDDVHLSQIAKEKGVELVTGIELSTSSGSDTLHVLGLFVEIGNTSLYHVIEQQQEWRRAYTQNAIESLTRDGWKVPMQFDKCSVVTKADIADAIIVAPENLQLLRDKFTDRPTRGQFIERLMNRGGPNYVEKKSIDTGLAVDAIHQAGGVAIMAHPVANTHEGMAEERVEKCLDDYAFDAVEAVYYYYDKSHGDTLVDEVEKWTAIARRHNLLISGGSDYHGSTTVGNAVELGMEGFESRPNIEILQDLRSRAADYRD